MQNSEAEGHEQLDYYVKERGCNFIDTVRCLCVIDGDRYRPGAANGSIIREGCLMGLGEDRQAKGVSSQPITRFGHSCPSTHRVSYTTSVRTSTRRAGGRLLYLSTSLGACGLAPGPPKAHGAANKRCTLARSPVDGECACAVVGG